MFKHAVSFLCAAIVSATLLVGPVRAAEPVDITYGYHPYWTGGWNGVIIKAKGLWKKYLPEGSKVRFEAHLTGPPMVNALLANKMQIGTMGDMPSLVATTKRKRADVRLVSVPMFSMGQNCNKMLVRKDAPDFKSVKDAMAWISGKPFAVHRGTCANRFVESVVEKGGFKPTKVLSMGIEVIASNFEAGKLDAAAMWEPHARRVVELGHAKYIATGAPWGETDADFTLMRQDFIEKHPEAAIGWMKAEIEAVQFMANNPKETAEILEAELTGYSKEAAWKAMYEKNPEAIGGADYNYIGKMVFDDDVLTLMKNGYAFLHRKKVLKSPDAPPNAYNDMPIKAALKEMGLTAPVAKIKGSDKPPF
ncbi:MAG: ABC transporter substrate-binding protein [Hyphomicrobiales bacterium]|nr:ABC transporter substrate-binding protein [Hyphomicrobiales bacterium]